MWMGLYEPRALAEPVGGGQTEPKQKQSFLQVFLEAHKMNTKCFKMAHNRAGSRYSIQTSEAKMQQTASHHCIC